MLLTATVVRGRYAIRLCVLNHTTADEDVAYALERVATADVDLAPPPAVAARPQVAGTTVGNAARAAGTFSAADLRRVRGFESVTEDQATRFLGVAREERYGPGDVVTERWAHARTFYIVVRGQVAVTIDGLEVNRLGVDEAFGEIAAIDWGRDFSYGRTATVSATLDTQLLAVPGAALRELMLDSATVDAQIRRIAYDRMHRVPSAT